MGRRHAWHRRHQLPRLRRPRIRPCARPAHFPPSGRRPLRRVARLRDLSKCAFCFPNWFCRTLNLQIEAPLQPVERRVAHPKCLALNGVAYPLRFCYLQRVGTSSRPFLVSAWIHLQNAFSRRIKRPTAPRPVPRMPHQTLLHRICMPVMQFLPKFLSRVDIEIIISPLPESPEFPARFWESK